MTRDIDTMTWRLRIKTIILEYILRQSPRSEINYLQVGKNTLQANHVINGLSYFSAPGRILRQPNNGGRITCDPLKEALESRYNTLYWDADAYAVAVSYSAIGTNETIVMEWGKKENGQTQAGSETSITIEIKPSQDPHCTVTISHPQTTIRDFARALAVMNLCNITPQMLVVDSK